VNLAQVILGFSDAIVNACMSTAPMYVMQQGRRRKLGEATSTKVFAIELLNQEQVLQIDGTMKQSRNQTSVDPTENATEKENPTITKKKVPSQTLTENDHSIPLEEHQGDDGFIAM
jgi:hypothetical protein